ncbi:hypothetical protein E0Z10_g1782 [Xylaria hypoxylon]|uniref:methionyl-tRNA formyltransferase n=1 Tax=Xylaria hypoxylon TaxID=37992 RepID=A0A4Z0Z5X8_9PEZI|nr:hypothetical protein E0Z10_g1782 [Xylaria hypoxylon]
MSHLFSSLEATAKSVALLFSSRLSHHAAPPRRVTGCLFHHGYHYATRSRQQHNISVVFLHQGRQYSTTSKKISDPLHVLFCGSDDFSCASLQALHDEHVQNPDLIKSIDVVVRPGKPTGRGYKTMRESRIRSLANSLGLQIHERDTFTGWNMPAKTNLIIAVSFGLFVPPRLLRAAKYGGLNLHPSLLPDLRGPAPLQHTLLAGRKLTGVSLQTLDDRAFDHGVILAQTPSDPTDASALRIPATCTTVAALQALVTPIAAQMLISGLRSGLHVPPHEPQGWTPDPESVIHAPKIAKTDRQLTSPLLLITQQEHADAEAPGTLARFQDAIGPLWFLSQDLQGRQKRIIIEALEEIPGLSPYNRPSILTTTHSPRTDKQEQYGPSSHKLYFIPFEHGYESLVFWDPIDSSVPGQKPVHSAREEDDTLYFGNYRILSLKVEGGKAKPALQALQNFIIR